MTFIKQCTSASRLLTLAFREVRAPVIWTDPPSPWPCWVLWGQRGRCGSSSQPWSGRTSPRGNPGSHSWSLCRKKIEIEVMGGGLGLGVRWPYVCLILSFNIYVQPQMQSYMHQMCHNLSLQRLEVHLYGMNRASVKCMLYYTLHVNMQCIGNDRHALFSVQFWIFSYRAICSPNITEPTSTGNNLKNERKKTIVNKNAMFVLKRKQAK